MDGDPGLITADRRGTKGGREEASLMSPEEMLDAGITTLLRSSSASAGPEEASPAGLEGEAAPVGGADPPHL